MSVRDIRLLKRNLKIERFEIEKFLAITEVTQALEMMG